MDNTIVFQYSNALSVDKMTAFLESQKEIKHWISFFPNSFILTTSLDPQVLSQRFDNAMGNQLHLVTVVDSEYWGRLSDWAMFKPSKYVKIPKS